MHEALSSFHTQLTYTPEITYRGEFSSHDAYVVCGMGGSHLPAGILSMLDPALPLRIHRGYGIPRDVLAHHKNTLVILISYSGNTEEVLDSFAVAQEHDLPCAVITTGGDLLSRAQETMTPHIQLPKSPHQPRVMVGHSTIALAHLVGSRAVHDLADLAGHLDSKNLEHVGAHIAEDINQSIPVVYASLENAYLSYIWKIMFNETGKITAFANVFPELNHNEMESMQRNKKTQHTIEPFHTVLLCDNRDHPRTQKRMSLTRQLYEQQDIPVTTLRMHGKTRAERVISTLLVGGWTAFALANHYGREPDAVPFISEFKKRLRA